MVRRRRFWYSYVQRQAGRARSLLCSFGAAILEGVNHESRVCVQCTNHLVTDLNSERIPDLGGCKISTLPMIFS